jgi:formylglycine-generating enzyme
MLRLVKTILICCIVCCTARADTFGSGANAFDINTVPIGNPGNPADTTGFGAVDHSYRIGQFEVTNAQYVEFLNAVAGADPHGLYSTSMTSDTRGGIVRDGVSGSYSYAVKPAALGGTYNYANKPVVFVGFFDTIRFVNWLHNGQGSVDTETGAYTLLPSDVSPVVPSNWRTLQRNPDARWWLPNQDEWYKAAYFDSGLLTYFAFATGTSSEPDNLAPPGDTNNSATFRLGPDGINSSYTTSQRDFPMTDIGAHGQAPSPYETFDQSGNAREWTETITPAGSRRIWGGDWSNAAYLMSKFDAVSGSNGLEENNIGFRVASAVPEPSTFFLLAAAPLGWAFFRRLRPSGLFFEIL